MKIKTTVILLFVFLALLAFVLFYESRSKGEKDKKEEKLVELSADDVQKMTLKKEDETITFEKNDQGEWMITEPLDAKADNYEVKRLAEDFSDLHIERVVEEEAADPVKYEIPRTELTLWSKGKEQPVRLLVGMENPLDSSLFAKREDDKRVVLLPSHLKSQLEKKTFDFREKDIFTFEQNDVAGIRLRAKDISWEAQKKEGDWFLRKPLASLADNSKIEDILRNLSGLKAKEFVSEGKTEEEMALYGLRDPEYQVYLNLPAKNQELTFSLHKEEDKIYATTSLSSKVIAVEEQALTDLEKKAEDLREKEVVTFNSWEASKVFLKRGEFALTLIKDKDGKWMTESEPKEEMDGSRVETFIRKIDYLEAAEFIDPPFTLAEFGFEAPQAEVKIWTKIDEKENEYQLFVGTEDTDKKQVVVRNPRLDYLFRVDSSILDEFPKEVKDWKVEAEEEKEKDEKK